MWTVGTPSEVHTRLNTESPVVFKVGTEPLLPKFGSALKITGSVPSSSYAPQSRYVGSGVAPEPKSGAKIWADMAPDRKIWVQYGSAPPKYLRCSATPKNVGPWLRFGAYFEDP